MRRVDGRGNRGRCSHHELDAQQQRLDECRSGALSVGTHTGVVRARRSGDIAYTIGERNYDNISALGSPIMVLSKALGHGGDLMTKNGGDFAKIDVAGLNWQLKADETVTGKGLLVG